MVKRVIFYVNLLLISSFLHINQIQANSDDVEIYFLPLDDPLLYPEDDVEFIQLNPVDLFTEQEISYDLEYGEKINKFYSKNEYEQSNISAILSFDSFTYINFTNYNVTRWLAFPVIRSDIIEWTVMDSYDNETNYKLSNEANKEKGNHFYEAGILNFEEIGIIGKWMMLHANKFAMFPYSQNTLLENTILKTELMEQRDGAYSFISFQINVTGEYDPYYNLVIEIEPGVMGSDGFIGFSSLFVCFSLISSGFLAYNRRRKKN